MPAKLILICLLLFSITAKAETELDLEAYRGDVVMLDFWASWCVPCRRSFPWMNAMHDKYGDEGLHIIAVNLDRSHDDAQKFLAAYPARFEVVYDPKAAIAPQYDVFAMPTSILIDRNGDIVAKHSGFKVKRQDEYEAALQAALSGADQD